MTSAALRVATPLDAVVAAIENQNEVVLAGAAGTGKTTIVQHLLDRRGVVLCAPTAKAAQRIKEVCRFQANTVHSLFYGAPTERWTKANGEVCRGWVEQLTCPTCEGEKHLEVLDVQVEQPDPDGPTLFPAPRSTRKPCHSCAGTGTVGLKHPAPGCPGCVCKSDLVFSESGALEDVQLLVVDESSMIGAEVARTIRSTIDQLRSSTHRVVILWVGDPAQLPPVGDDPGVNLHNPDVMLETVYRAQGGILELATRIRHSQDFTELSSALTGTYADVEFRTDGVGGLSDWRAGKSRRMAIVHTNRQRVTANGWVRETLKRQGPLVRGDRIIVRKNARQVPVWNGEVYVVQSADRVGEFTVVRATLDGMPNPVTVRFVVSEKHLEDQDLSDFGRDAPALGREFRPLAAIDHHDDCTFNSGLFEDDCSPKCKPGPLTGLHLVNAQHGFVITCHASQGSEADEVGVLWTPGSHRHSFADARSWLYTAVTRARKSLTVWTE